MKHVIIWPFVPTNFLVEIHFDTVLVHNQSDQSIFQMPDQISHWLAIMS